MMPSWFTFGTQSAQSEASPEPTLVEPDAAASCEALVEGSICRAIQAHTVGALNLASAGEASSEANQMQENAASTVDVAIDGACRAAETVESERCVGEAEVQAATGVDVPLVGLGQSKMLHELLAFMQKRAAKVSDEALEEVHQKLLELHNDANKVGATKTIPEETEKLLEFVRQQERALQARLDAFIVETDAPKKLIIPKLTKELEKELLGVKEGALAKGIMHSLESPENTGFFVEGFRPAPTQTAALREALKPSPQRVNDAIIDDLRKWCGAAAAGHATSLFKDGVGFRQTPSAVDAAMKEVSAQGVQEVVKMLDEFSRRVDIAHMTRLGLSEVGGAVRREVSHWEASFASTGNGNLGCRGLGGSVRNNDGAFKSNRIGFSKRLRKAWSPLQQDLNSVSENLRLAETSMARSKEALGSWEQFVMMSGSDGYLAECLVDEKRSVSERSAILAAAKVSDSLVEALVRALALDAREPAGDGGISVVEQVCDQACGFHTPDEDNHEADCQPEDVLAKEGVADAINSRLRLLLILFLVQRAAIPDASLKRIEANLGWVQALVDRADTGDETFLQRLEDGRAQIESSLQALVCGDAITSVSSATAKDRRRVSTAARLLLKSLESLKRSR